jgi:hypothetical protein
MSDLAIAENTNISLVVEEGLALWWTHIGNKQEQGVQLKAIYRFPTSQQAPSPRAELRSKANQLVVFNDCSTPGPQEIRLPHLSETCASRIS